MSHQLVVRVAHSAHPELDRHGFAKVVLQWLADCAKAGPPFFAWPSVAWLAEKSGYSASRVREGLRVLEAAGLLRDTGKRTGRTGQVVVREILAGELEGHRRKGAQRSNAFTGAKGSGASGAFDENLEGSGESGAFDEDEDAENILSERDVAHSAPFAPHPAEADASPNGERLRRNAPKGSGGMPGKAPDAPEADPGREPVKEPPPHVRTSPTSRARRPGGGGGGFSSMVEREATRLVSLYLADEDRPRDLGMAAGTPEARRLTELACKTLAGFPEPDVAPRGKAIWDAWCELRESPAYQTPERDACRCLGYLLRKPDAVDRFLEIASSPSPAFTAPQRRPTYGNGWSA